MTVRGNVVTRPSDATGERPIADAIVITGRYTIVTATVTPGRRRRVVPSQPTWQAASGRNR